MGRPTGSTCSSERARGKPFALSQTKPRTSKASLRATSPHHAVKTPARELRGCSTNKAKHPSELPATSAAAAAAAAAAASTTTATTAIAALALLGLIDAQGASAHIAAIQFTNSLGGIVVVHLDETEAAGATGLSVRNDRSGVDFTYGRKELLEFRIATGPG